MAQQMQAWQAAHPGSFESVFKFHDTISKPTAQSLKSGQVLVQVSRAALNPADYKIVELGMAARLITSFPKIPGMDLSGRIVAVADDVTEAKEGDLVLARATPTKAFGSLAQFTVCDREGYSVIPQDFDLEQAAGVGTAGLTAYQTIAPYVKAGDKVFINGGSGGVGLWGVQIAKAIGCQVTVSCSTGKADLCKSLGADDVIDYKTSDVVTELQKRGQVFSLCVDNVGNAPPNLYAYSNDFLLPGSHFVFVGGHVSAKSVLSLSTNLVRPSFLGGVKIKFVTYATANKRKDLDQLRDWMVEGKVKTIIAATYSFQEADKAFEYLKKGSSAGKIIIQVE
ncbi:quinone oxidoreductase [Fusarium heterosporum]|uniref:Quinone oxidoreductase n=1 Tax=Fusarium heterosporum TaxID=42747 RepID=A0A8H5TPT5_FUSHE|nr:quinone oxidoreductase [Fusarium heterosporum]